MLKIARRGRSLSLRCYISITCACMFHLWICYIKFRRSMHQSQRVLVYQFNYPYNSQKSPNYEITFLIQLCGGLLVALTNCTIDSFVSMFLLHVCAQLINLRVALNNTVDKLVNRTMSTLKFKEGLIAIVLRHEHLIRNAKTINDCYSRVLFLQMLAAAFQLCSQTFQIYTMITDHASDTPILKLVFLFFYACLVLTHFYFYCYASEKLITESTYMAYGVYQCKWYDLPSKDARDLMIIVYRSRIPLKLTAESFGIFSMELFGNTLKTSMGYLSALLTIKDG
nr:PREDICTED: odorant receptor 63a-like [Linepithema humile]